MQEVRDKVDSPQEIGMGPWRMALHPGVCAMGPCSGKVDWGGGGGQYRASVCTR